MESDQVIGTWKLVRFEICYSDGHVVRPFGEDAVGRLSYDAHGRMAVQIMSAHVPLFTRNDWTQAAPEEVQAAFMQCLSYFGTYALDNERGEMVHCVEASLFPNWVGTEQRRVCAFVDGDLTLSAPSLPHGDRTFSAVMRWARA